MRTSTAVGWSAAAAAIVLSLAIPASAASDDQARIDAAMAAFNERMTDAGWESQGPSDGNLGSDDDDEPSEGDEMIDACFGDLPSIFEGLEGADEFPGQTARSTSDDFTFTPPTAGTATTESMFSIPDEEEAAAIAMSIDDAHVDLIGEFLDVLGSEEMSECMKQAIEADMVVDPESTDPLEGAFEFEIEVATSGDLGVGEDSAEITFGISMNMFGAPIDLVGTMVFAGVDNDLIGVMHITTGTAEAQSGFDPVAELAAIVAAVGS